MPQYTTQQLEEVLKRDQSLTEAPSFDDPDRYGIATSFVSPLP